jgi:SAM-dependent methyltransferase
MSFKLYSYALPGQVDTGRGEYWRGEEFEEHLALTRSQTILPTVLSFLPKHGRILDAGCGLGRWLIYLCRLGYPVEGIDISADALQVIHKYDESIPLWRGDVESTSFADECFEAILSFGVMEHSEAGPEKALRETHRLLKKGGLLLVTVPYQNLLRRAVYNPLTRLVKYRAERRGLQSSFAEYRFSRQEMLHFLKEAGFAVLEVHPDDFAYPKSLGLYADWAWLLGNPRKRWELNTLGRIILRFLGLFPLWLYCSGILLVVKKC